MDVFQAIKSARIHRPGLIPNLVRLLPDVLIYYPNIFSMVILSPLKAHYVFCYEVLARYVENMDAYANFKTVV